MAREDNETAHKVITRRHTSPFVPNQKEKKDIVNEERVHLARPKGNSAHKEKEEEKGRKIKREKKNKEERKRKKKEKNKEKKKSV